MQRSDPFSAPVSKRDTPDVDPRSPPPTPRWVRAFGALAVVFFVGFVALHLLGGGFHHLH